LPHLLLLLPLQLQEGLLQVHLLPPFLLPLLVNGRWNLESNNQQLQMELSLKTSLGEDLSPCQPSDLPEKPDRKW
jgi:hypothetical protein